MPSAEIRWFWRAAVPDEFKAWFCNSGLGYPTAGGGSKEGRTDEYVKDAGQTQLGIKKRGGGKGVELKSLVAISQTELNFPPFAGPVEIWTKVSSTVLKVDPSQLVRVQKRRWVRKFDTTSTNRPTELTLDSEENPAGDEPLPENGCSVELTAVTLEAAGEVWWTFAFEAFGQLWRLQRSLESVANLLAARNPPALKTAILASYPAWLTDVLQRNSPASK